MRHMNHLHSLFFAFHCQTQDMTGYLAKLAPILPQDTPKDFDSYLTTWSEILDKRNT
jgi:hypothetical protein